MRLFFAVELPSEVQRALGNLRPVNANRDYRWVEPALMHLTLVFLGEQPAEKLDLLQQAGQSAAGLSRPGRLRLDAAGGFGAKRAPRVLWVSIDGDLAAVSTLQSQLANNLRESGFRLEDDRPFRPHITVARRRESAAGGAPAHWPPALPNRPSFAMDRLTLFESRLSPRGATYVSVAQFPLTPDR